MIKTDHKLYLYHYSEGRSTSFPFSLFVPVKISCLAPIYLSLWHQGAIALVRAWLSWLKKTSSTKCKGPQIGFGDSRSHIRRPAPCGTAPWTLEAVGNIPGVPNALKRECDNHSCGCCKVVTILPHQNEGGLFCKQASPLFKMRNLSKTEVHRTSKFQQLFPIPKKR